MATRLSEGTSVKRMTVEEFASRLVSDIEMACFLMGVSPDRLLDILLRASLNAAINGREYDLRAGVQLLRERTELFLKFILEEIDSSDPLH